MKNQRLNQCQLAILKFVLEAPGLSIGAVLSATAAGARPKSSSNYARVQHLEMRGLLTKERQGYFQTLYITPEGSLAVETGAYGGAAKGG